MTAGGVALIAIVGQLGSVAHLAAVKHVECVEHGELVEVAGDFQARAVTAADARTPSVGADYTLQHGHDHCAVAAFRRERVRSSAPATLPALTAHDRSAAPAAGWSAPAPAIAILDLAPKSSPPAV